MRKLSNINESIWSDMQDRGSGDIIKKEDDINLLDGEGFAEYLKKLYKNVDTPFHIIFDVENVITVPIIKYKGQTICVHYDCANNIVYGRFDFLYYHDPDLFEKLRKEYKTFMLKKSFSTYVKIEPRVGEFSNEFFIEIIDFYLENCNTSDLNIKKILVKNVNESVWSDMQDRGSGEITKKEDDYTNINELEPIDMGGSVLWAKDDLRWKNPDDGDEDYWFTYLEAIVEIDRSNKGWRLPTVEEVAELDTIPYKVHKEYVWFTPSSASKNSLSDCLVFYKHGFMHKTVRKTMKTPINTQYYYGWTSNQYQLDKNQINVYSISQFGLHHTPIETKKTSDFYTHDSGDWLCVRLVKDKK